MLTTNDIETLLEAWAQWRRINPGPRTGYPTATPFRRLIADSRLGSAPVLSDSEGCAVDRAVSKLRVRRPDEGLVVIDYYLRGLTMHEIAVRRQISRRTVSEQLGSACAFLDGVLYDFGDEGAQ